MKTRFVLMILVACFAFCACNANNFDGYKNEGMAVDQRPSNISSIEFSSLKELQNALDPQNETKLCSYFLKQGATIEQTENLKNMAKTIRMRNNIVPYINGTAIEFRNEEGYGNITMFASEKYELPCIFYHPKVSSGDNLYIKVTCIPDEYFQDYEFTSAADLIKIMSPNYPNIGNPGNYCNSVYNATVKLSDRNVIALVYEYTASKRNSTFFVYDNLLIEVRNDPEIWNSEWFSSLSFGSFEKSR